MQETPLSRWIAAQSAHSVRWLALYALLLAVQISALWYPAPDSVVYLSIARSLAAGEGLRAFGNPQIGLAPGYPLLLAPLFWLSGSVFVGLSLLHFALALILMFGVHRWLRHRCPEAAVFLTGVVIANVSLWVVYRRALSELAFTTALVWAAVLLDEAASRRRVLIGALLLLAATTMREVGVVFALSFAIAWWIGRRDCQPAVAEMPIDRSAVPAWLLAVTALPPIAAVGAFVVRETVAKASSTAPIGTHLDGFVHGTQPFAAQFLEGVRLRLSGIGRLLVPGMFKAYNDPGDWIDPNLLVYVPLTLLVLWGWSRLVRRRGGVLELGLPLYVGVYLLWPFEGDSRYLLPVLPVLVASAWIPIAARPGAPLLLLLAVVAHVAVAEAQWLGRDLPAARSCDRYWPDVERIAALVAAAPARGATAGAPPCVAMMLAHRLDRAVPHEPAPSTEWLVMPKRVQPPPGFRMLTVTRRLVLYGLGPPPS